MNPKYRAWAGFALLAVALVEASVEGGDGRGNGILEEHSGGSRGLEKALDGIGPGSGDLLGDLLDELGENIVLGNEVRLTIDLNQNTHFAGRLDERNDRAFLGMTGSLLAGAGNTLLTQERLGLLDVAACLGEGTLAIHHSGVGLFPE